MLLSVAVRETAVDSGKPLQSNMRISGDMVRRDGVDPKRTTSWDKHGPRERNVPL